jgi:uncharacterized protein (DUF885 family)
MEGGDRTMKRLVLAVLCLLSSALVAGAARSAEKGASEQLRQLFADDWEAYLEANPLFATMYGDPRYNDRLSDPSVAAEERQHRMTEEFLARLEKIDRDALSPADRANYDIYKRLKETALREFEFQSHLMPITNRDGFHVEFPQLPENVPLKTVKDYENYVARLEKFKGYAEAHIEVMRRGLQAGYVLPRIVLEGIDGAIQPHIVEDPEQSLLYKPFQNFPEGIAAKDRERLTQKGRAAIANSVVPGYRLFLEFVDTEYVPAARTDIGASSLPNGNAFYEHRVRRFTTLDVTPSEIHDIGISEVARIRAEMEKIIAEVEFQGSFGDFLAFLRSDPRFYAATPEDLMMHVALVLKKMDGALPTLFGTLPRMPYGIKPVPDYIAPKTTTAYYDRPAGDGTKAGFYFVNTYELRSRPLYEVEALSLHEAVPGHHLQIALQQELGDVPNFRRFTGFTAFVEGWALYSERLGLEVGFYEDPYSNFGRLTYEMWRACRLVVDTGIHSMGWTRQQAIDFMAAHTALALHNVTTEVDRYISWPGQALAYKIGELKIRELRVRAEKRLGPRFDVRAFHDVVLGGGAVPLDVLEANVSSWIEARARE